jgi:hypothetical protein
MIWNWARGKSNINTSRVRSKNSTLPRILIPYSKSQRRLMQEGSDNFDLSINDSMACRPEQI